MVKKVCIAPSLLSADFGFLAEEVKEITKAGADLIHLDVMDGHFVPNLTFGPCVINGLRKHTNLPFDIHLMISDAEKYIPAFADAGANIISFHMETTKDCNKVIDLIHKYNLKAGIALNPETPVSSILNLINELDMVLIMTVKPGFSGQTFMESNLSKISALKTILYTNNKAIDIEVDGGINKKNTRLVINAGANILVAGSAVFKNGPKNYEKNILSLRGSI